VLTDSTTATPLRRFRRKARLTQNVLAVRAGVSLTTISMAERTGFLTAASAVKLAAVLSCQPGDLRPHGAAGE